MRRIALFDINRTVIEFPNIARSYHKVTGQAFDKYQYQEEMERKEKEGTFNKDDYDYREWEDPAIVKRQIYEGALIYRNINLLRTFYNEGYDLRWLSGRTTSEDMISKWIEEKCGLERITGHALYLRDKGPEGAHVKKERALRAYALIYDHIMYMEDEEEALNRVRSIANINCIDANRR